MPSKLLNNTLSGIAQGVTQQYQEGRFDSQVTSLFNCTPSITRGMLRRNPLKFLGHIPSAIPSGDLYTYAYDRGTGDEQYLFTIGENGIWNTYNINTGAPITTGTSEYFKVPSGTKVKDSFKALTLGDHTFIVNTTVTIDWDTSKKASVVGYANMAFYWIKRTASVIVEQKSDTNNNVALTGSKSVGYTYQLNNCKVISITDSRPGHTDPDLGDAFGIAHEFQKNYDVSGQESLANSFDKAYAYNPTFSGTDWIWEDTFGNQASLGVWKTIKDSSDLPATLPKGLDGFIVKIQGSGHTESDDYFLKYDYENKAWREVPGIIETKIEGPNYPTDPTDYTITYEGVYTTIDASTMPHVLYRQSNGLFEVDIYKDLSTGESKWGERHSGGLDELHDPSFIGSKLNNIFFHKNRLGVLTNDSIVLSSSGEYGDFFFKTVQEVFDNDPIDLAIASTDVTVLRHAVPTAGQLIIFSDDTQFTLDSVSGNLTPQSADISAVSSYTYGKGADAKAIGDRILFSNQGGGFSQVYAYRAGSSTTKISQGYPMTLHLPSYIDKSIYTFVGHDSLGQIFMLEESNKKEIVCLTSISRGEKELQNAFHRWSFDKEIINIYIIKDSLVILFKGGSLCYIDLDIPGSIEYVTYTDEYTLGNYTDYISYILFSEFFVRNAEGKGTKRGRYQLRSMLYTITKESRYTTLISNKNQLLINTGSYMGPLWVDTDVWDDTLVWLDVVPYYVRVYESDDKITLLTSSKDADIVFRSSQVETTKGFELSTLNIEAFFSQRSTRR